MNTFPVLLAALCVYALAYRYYGAFIAAKALALDDRRTTPAHAYADGHNYVASPRWVLFGHHFAAIAGAGPLVGPTLAAQFGFAPGFLWLLIGAVLAGCTQDITVLVASVRHRGRSLADIARTEISPFAGLVGRRRQRTRQIHRQCAEPRRCLRRNQWLRVGHSPRSAGKKYELSGSSVTQLKL